MPSQSDRSRMVLKLMLIVFLPESLYIYKLVMKTDWCANTQCKGELKEITILAMFMLQMHSLMSLGLTSLNSQV